MTRMSSTCIVIILACVSFFIKGGYGYDQCTLYTYCEDLYYCCDYNTRCCAIISIGGIIGIVIGGLVFVGVVIAGICVCMQKKGQSGRVIAPHQPGGANVTVVSTGHYPQQPQGQPVYNQPFYGQPAYFQGPQAPPPYSLQQNQEGTGQPGKDMAYPPPPSNY